MFDSFIHCYSCEMYMLNLQIPFPKRNHKIKEYKSRYKQFQNAQKSLWNRILKAIWSVFMEISDQMSY